jgi:sigma-E factor negative regulatory protein RseB
MGAVRPAARATAALDRWLAVLFMTVVATAGAPASHAQDRARPDVATPVRTPLQWVQAMQQAAVRVNYSGTVVYQAGGDMRSSRITHVYDGKRSQERVQTLDGKPREYLRTRTDSNDEVHCLMPESRRIVIEHRAIEDPFPGLIGAPAADVLKLYQVEAGGIERVAGIECQVLTFVPRDALRYGYRLCVESASGLLLKSQMVNDQSDVLEQVAFTDVRIGERIDRARLKPAWSTEGWAVERSDYRRVDLAKAGWVVPAPNGFRRTKEIIRRMGTRDAMQVVFSDGLATVSVFIEPGADLKPLTEGVQMMGPTAAYSRRVGDALVTVVGEVPPAAVRGVAGSVEFNGPR